MSSSLIRGPSAQAASLGPDELLGLELLRGRVEELLQTVDGLEDALLAQTQHAQTVRDHADRERERAQQAIEHAEIAQNDEAWWRNIYYQENYRLCAQVADLEEEALNLKGALRDPRSLQAAADCADCRVRDKDSPTLLITETRPGFSTAPMRILLVPNDRGMSCLVCQELIKHRPIRNLLVEHATAYLPDMSTGRAADFRPEVEEAWAQLFPETFHKQSLMRDENTLRASVDRAFLPNVLKHGWNGSIIEEIDGTNVDEHKIHHQHFPYGPKSELDLLRMRVGELLEEVDDLKDELKEVKEQVGASQNEAASVRDLEDEITALQEENIQAGRHSREGVAECRENRQACDGLDCGWYWLALVLLNLLGLISKGNEFTKMVCVLTRSLLNILLIWGIHYRGLIEPVLCHPIRNWAVEDISRLPQFHLKQKPTQSDTTRTGRRDFWCQPVEKDSYVIAQNRYVVGTLI
ncbi:hypothetical protein ARMGADRAFT_1039190 [Armillaria gallica]|uniref:Uncharacterized protein n=1 Tax=Armillaria gallica TaxID=47427 RepID=A0A2H3CQV3_ARMGA|nr:hypothetical protein ARMGADRAFT_1039190 [Armillaria gallica]